jgi:hypothetical protein
MAWSGIAKVGSKTEWPPWHPTPERNLALGVPKFVAPGTGQSDGLARALSLLRRQGHAVPDSRHQPAGIYRRVDLVGLHPHDQRGRHRSLRPRRLGTVVVVLEPKHGDSPFNSKMALQGGGNTMPSKRAAYAAP